MGVRKTWDIAWHKLNIHEINHESNKGMKVWKNKLGHNFRTFA